MGRPTSQFLDTTIIIETYNLAEGADFDRLRHVLDYADCLRRHRLGVEVMLADASDADGPSDMALARLTLNYPKLRVLRVPGAGYEGIKHAAAEAARTRYIAYIDGDCLPRDDNWIDRLLAPLQAGEAGAVTGTTIYEGASLWSQVLSVMDFGYALESVGGPIGCYSSNNVAFDRATRLATPAPGGPIRCSCFAHTGLLKQMGSEVIHESRAVVGHELPDFFSERVRRGYDLVAVCWVDRHLREARWLRLGPLAAPLFYGQNVAIDWRRMKMARQRFGWKTGARLWAFALPPLIRMVDLVGILRALTLGPSRKWSAYGAVAPLPAAARPGGQ